jgi:NADH/NAD ratio-sensing transcriptional regulator Rex
MASSGISIGKSLVCMLKGGNQTITNLTVKDINSLENVIKAEFDEAGTLTISNCLFERVTKASSTVVGGTTKVILNHGSATVSILSCNYTLCKSPET